MKKEELMQQENTELTQTEKEELNSELSKYFHDIQAISSDIIQAREMGTIAQEKAMAIKTGPMESKTKSIENLKEAVLWNTDTSLKTLEAVDKVSMNQIKLSEICGEFVKIGYIDMARNRAVVSFIQKVLQEGAEASLSEEAKLQLLDVIQELKKREDINAKLERQNHIIEMQESRIWKLEKWALLGCLIGVAGVCIGVISLIF